MREFPSLPRMETVSEQSLAGHLWLLEKIDGAPLRFQLQESGMLRFGDRTRVYADHEAIPEPYRHAVRHVREHLDRHALREALDDVERVVFFGEATHYQTINYEWDRLPSFLGFDVWAGESDGFLPPDAVEGIFERLGLHPVNVFERELHARDFDPGSYDFPDSAWYDGPPEGVVIRDKTGNRAQLLHPDHREENRQRANKGAQGENPELSAEQLAARYATRNRFETVAATLERQDGTVTFDALYDRVLESILREHHTQLYGEAATVDPREFRSEVAGLTRGFLEE